MAYQRTKTEMHGDTSRHMHRADAKQAANRERRFIDARVARDGAREHALEANPDLEPSRQSAVPATLGNSATR